MFSISFSSVWFVFHLTLCSLSQSIINLARSKTYEKMKPFQVTMTPQEAKEKADKALKWYDEWRKLNGET